jgi:hypothetical protein
MIRYFLLRKSTLPAGWLVFTFALAASVVTPSQAQNNSIERVTVASEGRDNVAFDIIYNYTGDQGDNVFMSVMMADNGKTSPHYAFKPGRVERGRRSTQVNLGVSGSAPNLFSTNQIHVAMYVGGRDPFIERSFYFPKTWSRPGGTLQPALRIVGTVKPLPAIPAPVTPSADVRGSSTPVRRILPNGHVELRYPDGTIRERYRGGETVTKPGQSKPSIVLYSSAQPPTPPGVPPDQTHTEWLDAENKRLLGIIRTLVGNDEPSIQNYLSREGSGASLYQRVSSRTDAIDRMVRP